MKGSRGICQIEVKDHYSLFTLYIGFDLELVPKFQHRPLMPPVMAHPFSFWGFWKFQASWSNRDKGDGSMEHLQTQAPYTTLSHCASNYDAMERALLFGLPVFPPFKFDCSRYLTTQC